MNTFNIIEISPIVLAVFALIFSATMYKHARRKMDKGVNILSIIACLILIIAQTSWLISIVVVGSDTGTLFSNHLWSIFNNLVMVIIIMFAAPRGSKL